MEMDHAVTESALVQQLEPEADVAGQRWIAASHNDGGEKQMALVDQTELQCLRSERRTAHRDIARRSRLQMLDRFGLELPLDPCLACRHPVQALGVHDLVRCLPDLRVLLPR